MIEAMVFVLIVALGFVSLISLNHRLHMDMNNSWHINSLTTYYAPNNKFQFESYCKNNNIKYEYTSGSRAKITLGKKNYNIQFHSGKFVAIED